MIKVKDLTFYHAGKKLCLENISLEIHRGEVIGILGENGQGKSTLLKLMAGFYPTTFGEVSILGKQPYSQKEILEELFFIGHDELMIKAATVRSFLDYMACCYPRYSKKIEKDLVKILSLDENKSLSDLSTGLIKRVQFVAAVSSCAKIIFMDEVSAVLDPKGRKKIIDIIMKINQKYGTIVVFATNVQDEFYDIAHRILYVEDKKISSLDKESYLKKIA